MKTLEQISIKKHSTISSALKQMDNVGRKLLIVVDDDEKFISVLSIGDIQRAIIQNKSLDTPIINILREEVKVAHIHESLEDIKNQMRLRRNEFMPVVDEHNTIQKVIFYEDLFIEKQPVEQFNLPVIIMAGGKGTRMQPLTNVIPKPLIPINKKTIIEDIMDRFLEYGSYNFYVSVNYKADMIRYYFETLNNPEYNITYFQEDKPLGTAGSLGLLKGQIQQTFFVSNCDILIDDDYSEMLKYHRENKNEITLIAAMKHLSIPYGTLKTTEGGILTTITEKPDLTFKINSGMYIIEPHLINEIPENKIYHITHLIEKVMHRSGKVGVFPVSEKSWRDIGNWHEYINLTRGE
ncbi:MAG TPA: mannose-1-phosphate guanylyltransferase [Bacteroidales bacterium]|jgi:dTDP-glucose pyrophosphorylase|nr:mannose-1-phosphate guanylyltransferase [Bacteroidales bacterium]